MKKKYIIITVVVLIVAAIAFVLFNNKKEMNEEATKVPEEFAIPVQTAKVGEKTLSTGLIATGEFAGWEEVTVVAESQGSIQYLRVKEGQYISKGQVIAKVDAISLGSQLSSANSALAKANKDVARYERLLKVGAVSQSALEDVRLQSASARANIAQIKQQLGFTVVKSPISGYVNKMMVEETSFVMPGNEIAEIVQIDRLKIIVNVAEENLSKIKIGQAVNIKTDVYPMEVFNGTVRRISVKADESRKFEVTIEVGNSREGQLRAGMFAEVDFSTLDSNETNAIVIPRESIVGSLQNPSVYVVKNNVVSLKQIQVGAVIDNNVTVLGGLNTGEEVVTKGIINLKEGTKVKITNK